MGETAPNIHVIKRVGNKVIEKYQIITTDLVVYFAWEPSVIMGRHSTITLIDNKWYGRIGTRPLPPDIDKIPVGPERFAAVEKWHEDQYQEAYNLIIGAFPEAQAGKKDMGEITLPTRDQVRGEVWERTNEQLESEIERIQKILDGDNKADSISKVERAIKDLPEGRVDGLEDVADAIEEYRDITKKGLTPEEYQEAKQDTWDNIMGAVEGLQVSD